MAEEIYMNLRRLALAYLSHFEASHKTGTVKVKPDAPEAVAHLVNAVHGFDEAGPDKFTLAGIRTVLQYISYIDDELAGVASEEEARAAIEAHGDIEDFTAWLHSRPVDRASYIDGVLSREESPPTAYALLREAKEDEMRWLFDRVLNVLKRRLEEEDIR